MPTLNELTQRADGAVSTFETTVRQLHRPDGSRQFSDPVHNQMEGAARNQALNEVASLEEQADQVLAAAQAEADSVQDDPTAHMSTTELAAASARFSLVREEATGLSLTDVHQRLSQAMAAKDRVSLYLWSRVAQQRLGAIDEDARRASMVNMSDQPNGGAVAPLPALDAIAANKLRALLADVNGSLVPEAARNSRTKALETVEAAQAFKHQLRQRLDRLSGNTSKHQSSLEREFRQSF